MPIAIVGVSGRYPGEASSPEKLWNLISQGRSAMTEIPKDRFNIDSFYHPHNERSGTLNARGGHYMQRDVDAFDAPFFSILPAEAKALDPQQRMALECAYEAFENAGIPMSSLVGTDTSCYVGSFSKDYTEMVGSDQEDLPLYHGIGTGTAILSNRISWFFDLHGPSISIDTACSSALVALHLGCQSLRTGESKMAVVGGVNFMLLPGVMTNMSSLHFLSPDARCHSFDDRANGYSRGEGASFVVLKPLDHAIRDHDMIRAVIRNTSCGQDGNTPGITVPSGEAQEALIRKCYTEAGLSLNETQYVEAHGTGTQQGDFREAAALSATLGQSRPDGDRLLVGSIKTNIGHLEGASGLAQVTKAIFMLEKAQIPPNLWYENPNPRIPMDEWNIKVVDELMPFPGSGPRRISINSFGYGGTNAHAIIDDAYHFLKDRHLKGNHNTLPYFRCESPILSAAGSDSGFESMSSPDEFAEVPLESLATKSHLERACLRAGPPAKLVIWSSNEQAGVERVSKQLSDYLTEHIDASFSDDQAEQAFFDKFVRTLTSRRNVLPWKAFTVASSIKELCFNMNETTCARRSVKASKVAFIFTGQGAQWAAMGRELLAHRVFEQSLAEAGSYLVELGCSWSLIAELLKSEKDTQINTPALSQPVCTALQVALVDLLRHWGITPSAVAGHSSGEIAAAYAKGALSRKAAWAIAYHRGRLSDNLPGFAPKLKGGMLACGLGAAAAQRYVSGITDGHACIACKNSPSSTTISGDLSAIHQIEGMLTLDGVFARRIMVSTAYHSNHMGVIADLYLDSIKKYLPRSEDSSEVPMFSSVTGNLIKSSELTPSYWVANMTNPVDFDGAVTNMIKQAPGSKRAAARPQLDLLLELGPHSALQGPLKQILKVAGGKFAELTTLSLLRRGQDACRTSLEALGQLIQAGCQVKLDAVNQDISGGKDGFIVDLPAYAWNHNNKYWTEPQVSKNYRFRKHPRTDLLGALLPQSTTIEPIYRNILKVGEIAWTEHHKVQGTVLYPAAGMIVAAIEAASQRADPTRKVVGYELKDVLIGKAIVLHESDTGTETMLHIRPWRSASQSLAYTWEEFKLMSRNDDGWETNCTGLVRVEYESVANATFANEKAEKNARYAEWFHEVESSCKHDIDVKNHYTSVAGIGYNFTGPFQSLVSIRKGDYKSRCDFIIPDTKAMMPHQFEYPHTIHPTVLDAVIQMGICAATAQHEELNVAAVPTYIKRVYVAHGVPKNAGTVLNGCAAIENPGFENPEQTFVVMDDDRLEPLILFEGLRSTALRRAELAFDQALGMRKLIAQFEWQEDLDKLDSEKLQRVCSAALHKLPAVEKGIVAEMEHAAFIYMKRLLADIKDDEYESLAPHFKQFYRCMKKTYDEVASGQNKSQQQQGRDWLSENKELETQLLQRVADRSSDGAALCAHGEHLASIMRGETLAIEVLMQENRLNNFYQFGIGNAEIYAQLAKYVDLLAHRTPDMKILEIGAGTGGATTSVLGVLGGQKGTSPRFSSYTFTDISTGFFEKAQEKFKPWLPYMTFCKLDIEKDPVENGCTLGDYDLVIAANVLHATKSMEVTLSNVRKLMKPDAKLVMSEITNPQLRFHMIVGSFDGWWAGKDDGREWGPTMSVESWDDVLQKSGFTGVDLALDDIPDSIDHAYSVLVSSGWSTRLPTPKKDVLLIESAQHNEEIDSFLTYVLHEIQLSGVCTSRVQIDNATNLEVSGKACIFALDCSEGSSFLANVSEVDFGIIKRLILECSSSLWLTRGATINSANPAANMIAGAARCIRAENPTIALTTLDLDSDRPLDAISNINSIMKVFSLSLNAIDEQRPDWEYAIRDEKLFIPRLLLDKGANDLITSLTVDRKAEPMPFKQPGRQLELTTGSPGRLDTLCFTDDSSYHVPLADDEVEIKVKAVGLNFKDVMVAMGQLQEKHLGLDCSGVVSRLGSKVSNLEVGQPVMTWTLGSFKTFARNKARMCLPIPKAMSFTDAASLPLAFCTAYYSLFEVGRLRKGETVLIHGGAGGVGQAAIMLAQYIGANVLATVSSVEKKDLIMEQFGLPTENILNSRDTSFADGVMRLTQSKGVNVVVNSMAGEALHASWSCMAWFGRFVEIGKKDIEQNTSLGMAPFARNCTYSSVDLVGLLRHDLATSSRVFQEVMELFEGGIVHPIRPSTVMRFSEIEEAFRLLQTGKHTGKIILEAHDDDVVPTVPAKIKQITLRSDATYVLSGGTGGLGRSLATWMVDHGARHIAFISRSGDQKQEAKDTIEALRGRGAQAQSFACDVSDVEAVKSTLEVIKERFPPVKGVIQGAMVLQDTIFSNMTYAQWRAAVGPKVQGTNNLHSQLPSDLDFFVMLSSSAGVAGSRGQSNYAAGNTYQDALAHYRRNRGQHGAVIDLGVVLDVGYVAESTSADVQENTKKWSFVALREKEVQALVQAAITGVSVNTSTPTGPQIISGLGTGGMANLAGHKIPWWFSDAKFAHLREIDTHQVSFASDEDTALLHTQLGKADTFDAVVELVSVALLQKLSKALMVDVEDIDTNKALSRFGVDSLLAVEIRAWIFTELQADISVFQLLSNNPLSQLASEIAGKSKAVPTALIRAHGMSKMGHRLGSMESDGVCTRVVGFHRIF